MRLLPPEHRTFAEKNRRFYWREGGVDAGSTRDVRSFQPDDLDFVVLQGPHLCQDNGGQVVCVKQISRGTAVWR